MPSGIPNNIEGAWYKDSVLIGLDSFSINSIQRNIIIGGNFSTNPWQRGTTFTAPTDATYTADRWLWNLTGTGVVNVLKTTDAPTIAQAGVYSTDCLHVDVTTADAAMAATDVYSLQYRVEGYDIVNAGFGQTGTRKVTLSFWHKHTKTGTYCVCFRNSASDRAYVVEYTQSTTDTWEYSKITIPVDTSGTWLYTNGTGLKIHFIMAIGSNFQTAANAWTAGNYLATSNQVNAMDNTANNFKLALVQLAFGEFTSSLYPFEDAKEVLARCQRYYEKSYDIDIVPGTVNSLGANEVLISTAIASGVNLTSVRFMTPKRAQAAVTLYSTSTGASGKVADLNGAADVTAVAANLGFNGYQCQNNSGGALTAGRNFRWHHVAQCEL